MVAVKDILCCPDNTDKLASQIIQEKSFDALKEAILQCTLFNKIWMNQTTCFIDSKVSQDDQKLVFTQRFLRSLIPLYHTIGIDSMQALGEFIIKALKDKMFFETEVYHTRIELSKVYEGQGQQYLAGLTLAQINYDSPKLNLSVKDKAERYLQIITFFFEMEEQNASEVWINKASQINYDSLDDKLLKFRFENLFAANLDFQRKFLPAAQKYYLLSNYPDIEFEDANSLLNASSQCAILGNAGPLRSRILASLYKDERIQSIPNFEMLELTFMQRLVSKEQKDKFAGSLKKHQLQMLRENYTVLDEAILQHNIIATSKIYDSISMKSLARLVHIDQDLVELCIQKMIEEKRVHAKIDQLTEIVVFLKGEIKLSFSRKYQNMLVIPQMKTSRLILTIESVNSVEEQMNSVKKQEESEKKQVEIEKKQYVFKLFSYIFVVEILINRNKHNKVVFAQCFDRRNNSIDFIKQSCFCIIF